MVAFCTSDQKRDSGKGDSRPSITVTVCHKVVMTFMHVLIDLQAHNDLIRTYESKLATFGVPTEELGFKPLKSTVAGQTLGQGPAGLVASPS